MNDRSKTMVLLRKPAWGLLILIALSPLAGCSSSRLPVVPVVLPPLSEVVVNPPLDALRVGDIANFTATAYDTLGQPVMGAGFSWRSGETQVFTTNMGKVTAISEGQDTLFATAADGTVGFAIVSVFRDTGWVIQNSRTANRLNGVHFLSDGRSGWAVGAGGTVTRTTDAGTVWTVQTSGTPYNLNAVWFTSATEGWAVGDVGTVLRTSNGGTSWTRQEMNTTDNLSDVCFVNPFSGLIVGVNGLVFRTVDAGATWTRDNITLKPLRSVSVSGPYGWTVGDAGALLGSNDGGVSWPLSANITAQPFESVWTRGANAAWAVGNQGLAARIEEISPGSFSWQLRPAGALNQLEGVCFPDDSTGYAVGYNGAGIVLRSDDAGETWSAQTSRASRRLNDVYFVDAMRGWAVGDGGEIVHTARGGRE